MGILQGIILIGSSCLLLLNNIIDPSPWGILASLGFIVANAIGLGRHLWKNI